MTPEQNAAIADIRACPFCGGEPVTMESGDGGKGLMIECIGQNCPNPHVSYYDHASAIRVWNRRAVSLSRIPQETGAYDVERVARALCRNQLYAIDDGTDEPRIVDWVEANWHRQIGPAEIAISAMTPSDDSAAARAEIDRLRRALEPLVRHAAALLTRPDDVCLALDADVPEAGYVAFTVGDLRRAQEAMRSTKKDGGE